VLLLLPSLLALGGCEGAQSSLSPAGREAEDVATLFTWMSAGALLIWALMVGLALWLPRRAAPTDNRPATILIVGGGVVFPFVVLSLLLTGGLPQLPRMLALSPEPYPSITVVGTQWWWRVQYALPNREPIELANELRLPVGRRINVTLLSQDVIHSFWIPSIAGKLDAIPGRVNRMALEPTRTGVFRGACAEFCGASHARMNLIVEVVEPAAFDAWIQAQAGTGAAPDSAEAERGRQVFHARGCVTCHTIRGTSAVGVLGPDLTHVASRHTLAAGLLPMSRENFVLWIANTERLKPAARMPAFAGLPPDELAALAEYLMGLR
jgi:cytochrome c oxidase subunit 2